MTNSALRKSDAKPAADSVSRWKANYCNDLEGTRIRWSGWQSRWSRLPVTPAVINHGRGFQRRRSGDRKSQEMWWEHLRWSARACAPKWSLSRIISSGKIKSEGKGEARSTSNRLLVLSSIRWWNGKRIFCRTWRMNERQMKIDAWHARALKAVAH